MPFQSEAQRKFMYSQKPELAKEFEAATPKNEALPAVAPDKERKKAAMKKMVDQMGSENY